jgi:CubicO group peptidase (beta-lactamase class C family)
MKHGTLVAFTLTLMLLADCAPEAKRDASRAPERLDDGWNVASPTQFAADVALLDSMVARTESGDYVNIHSVVVVKDGSLVLEAYFDGNDRHTLHQIRSATKCIGSMLTGIAIDRGFIDSVNEPIHKFFAEDYEPAGGWTDRARQVEIRHFLSMMSGYECDDLTTNFACENAMYNSNDWVQYSLDLPFAHSPGEHWAYNSSSLILVGEAVARSSELEMKAFADRYLFGPLGIERFRWQFSPKGRAWIGGGARMTPREMAKIGQLMLNRGLWNAGRDARRRGLLLPVAEELVLHRARFDYCLLGVRQRWSIHHRASGQRHGGRLHRRQLRQPPRRPALSHAHPVHLTGVCAPCTARSSGAHS